MANRFFVSDLPAPGEFLLDGPEAHHLAKVSRAEVGDKVVLFCGDGFDYPATIRRIGRRAVVLDVAPGVLAQRESPTRVMIAAPLPKADRGTFMIEKLTELGVSAYVPLITEHSIITPGEGKTERLRRIVLEASKQCGRSVFLQIEPPQNLAAFLARPDLPTERWLAEPGAPHWQSPGPEQDTVFLIGPEGGLTEIEVDSAKTAGFRLVGLGPRILRVETAALALAALTLA